MSLVQCPICEHSISSTAMSCPNCGDIKISGNNTSIEPTLFSTLIFYVIYLPSLIINFLVKIIFGKSTSNKYSNLVEKLQNGLYLLVILVLVNKWFGNTVTLYFAGAILIIYLASRIAKYILNN